MKMIEIATTEMPRRFNNNPIPTLPEIFNDIIEVFQEDAGKLKSSCRKRHFVIIRQVYCYVARKTDRFTLDQIGQLIGNRDHSTVTAAVSTAIKHLKSKDIVFMEYFDKYLENSKVWYKI